MSLRQLLRKPLHTTLQSILLPRHYHLRRVRQLIAPIRRSSTSSEAQTRSRVDRVLNRLPKFLHPYTNGLRHAPVTHVVSFLILHEITAIVPLVGLAGLFHWMGWIPDVLAEGNAVAEGMQKFGRYFARKGWFGFDKKDAGNALMDIEYKKRGMSAEEKVENVQRERWSVGESGSRILVEVATAYAITKVLLPGRVILSVWATPWFARNVLGGLRRVFGGGALRSSAAAGTGAPGAGVAGKVSRREGNFHKP